MEHLSPEHEVILSSSIKECEQKLKQDMSRALAQCQLLQAQWVKIQRPKFWTKWASWQPGALANVFQRERSRSRSPVTLRWSISRLVPCTWSICLFIPVLCLHYNFILLHKILHCSICCICWFDNCGDRNWVDDLYQVPRLCSCLQNFL